VGNMMSWAELGRKVGDAKHHAEAYKLESQHDAPCMESTQKDVQVLVIVGNHSKLA